MQDDHSGLKKNNNQLLKEHRFVALYLFVCLFVYFIFLIYVDYTQIQEEQLFKKKDFETTALCASATSRVFPYKLTYFTLFA